MPCREMTVSLDEVCCLLHLPIEGSLLDHQGIPTKSEGVDMMVRYIFGKLQRMLSL
ncbi:putative IMP dehydrogenase/GMP reductase, partial [Trifolium medium]|nr:putative IMP dehydrogenase/GMP reductase [Trifolium medium]